MPDAITQARGQGRCFSVFDFSRATARRAEVLRYRVSPALWHLIGGHKSSSRAEARHRLGGVRRPASIISPRSSWHGSEWQIVATVCGLRKGHPLSGACPPRIRVFCPFRPAWSPVLDAFVAVLPHHFCRRRQSSDARGVPGGVRSSPTGSLTDPGPGVLARDHCPFDPRRRWPCRGRPPPGPSRPGPPSHRVGPRRGSRTGRDRRGCYPVSGRTQVFLAEEEACWMPPRVRAKPRNRPANFRSDYANLPGPPAAGISAGALRRASRRSCPRGAPYHLFAGRPACRLDRTSRPSAGRKLSRAHSLPADDQGRR